jgi:hypothetical protein
MRMEMRMNLNKQKMPRNDQYVLKMELLQCRLANLFIQAMLLGYLYFCIAFVYIVLKVHIIYVSGTLCIFHLNNPYMYRYI